MTSPERAPSPPEEDCGTKRTSKCCFAKPWIPKRSGHVADNDKMSKRFKSGSLCVYCSKQPAITGDHIFAREFFLESARVNLPKAPICTKCNNEKSKLEHYLTAVLPFGGQHPDAPENLTSMVPKRLRKNVRLHRQLSKGISAGMIPLEGGKIEKLFGLISRGLAWYHWNIYLNEEDHLSRAVAVTPTGAQLLDDHLFKLTGRDCVNESVGNCTFRYEGKQGTDAPTVTIWRFSIYGGLLVSDGRGHFVSQIVAITGPSEIVSGFISSIKHSS